MTANKRSADASLSASKPGEERKPFWAKCAKCGHIWIAAYAPMEITAFAKAVGAAHCPMCAAGPKDIRIAKQEDGKLLEPTP